MTESDILFRSSVADLMFGMRQRDTGLTKYPVRNRQRVITFAATLVLKRNNEAFVRALRERLAELYPLHAALQGGEEPPLIHLFFPTRSYVTEVRLPFCSVL